MKWKVIYSDKASSDLRGIYEYIYDVLCVPDTAKNQMVRISKRMMR